ncbi:MAG: hypothetical protein JST44_01705 [Cyanobacteria bacterium SZAS LIN-5]|nr:hypothetical protein [Cyanobacteria bacterium SZAS LIN-5]RTL40341.1 MAG: hypothetical protein EKK48_16460 [Candidatus Melainabacteria bacterium]
MVQTTFTESEILGQLDDCALNFDFPMLDNGYIAPADVKLHAFADELRWAIIIEDLGYHTRTGDHDGMTDCISYYGNCLTRKPGSANEDFLVVTGDGPDGKTFEDETNWYLRKPIGQITIRDELVSYDCTREKLEQLAIPLQDTQASGTQLLRSLVPRYRNLFFATERELRRRIPFDLPCLLSLSEWHHPDLAGDELPSVNETFQQIARVLHNLDSALYAPSLPPNTHWSNWPEGGNL